MPKKDYFIPAGNKQLSIPTLQSKNASIERMNFLSMKYSGLVELRGTDNKPFLEPFIIAGGKEIPLKDLEWERINYWIPGFRMKAAGLDIQGIILTPVDERGFIYQFKVTGKQEKLKLGFRLNWDTTSLRVYSSKNIKGSKRVYRSHGWFEGITLEFWTTYNEFTLAIGADRDINSPLSEVPHVEKETADPIETEFSVEAETGKDKTETVNFYFALGPEETGAFTTVFELQRRTAAKLFTETREWLAARSLSTGRPHIDKLMNMNFFFNYFYATGKTLDTEEYVLVTSRSHRYYVCAAYWDRDSLLWSIPSIMQRDPGHARMMLDYLFTKQIKNVGIHCRYINGAVLEPGFELDELCAPVIALGKYLKATKDYDFLRKENVVEGLESIFSILEKKKHYSADLYETLSFPSDDFAELPYLAYDNALVYRALLDYVEMLKVLKKTRNVRKYILMAKKVKAAVYKHCVGEGPYGKMFYWAVNLEGGYQYYDEPPGSLKLLPHYGFCSAKDPVYMNTVRWIHSEHNKYSFHTSPLNEVGCSHNPHPWVLGLCNSLLSGRGGKALEVLNKTDLDGGIACESIDEVTGEPTSGEAFATCAGFLAFSLGEYLVPKGRQKPSSKGR